jgi:hypothetical protein
MRWLVLAFAVAAIGQAWWRRHRNGGRQRRLMLLCEHAGLDFAPVDLRLDTAWLPFPMFGRPKHGTENVVWDRRLGDDVHVFDLWYEEPADERGSAVRRTLTCAVVPLRSSCPRLRVTSRDVVDDVARALGGEEVRLELEAFDRRFRVETDDVRFAVAFLDQRLMEALLGLPDGVGVDVNEDVLLLSAPLLPAERVLVLFEAAVAIRRRIPRVLSSLFPPRPEQGVHERRWLQGRWSSESTGSDVA